MLKRSAFPCTGNSKFKDGVKIFNSNSKEDSSLVIKNGSANISCEY